MEWKTVYEDRLKTAH